MSYDTANVQNAMTLHSVGFFRILDTLPSELNVDLYLNDKLIAQNISYTQLTSYMPLCQGTYKLSLYPSNTNENPILESMFTINEDDIFTVAAILNAPDELGFVIIKDAQVPIEKDTSMVRFSNLSPNAPAVDITLPDGTVLFSDVSYQELTPYIEVTPSDYIFQLRLAGTPTIMLTIPDTLIAPNNFYTIYALGLVNAYPSLETISAIDSNDYIDQRKQNKI